jgi:rhomboid protease GluP
MNTQPQPSPREPQQVLLRVPVTRPLLAYVLLAAITLVFLAQLYFYQTAGVRGEPITPWGMVSYQRILNNGEFYRLFTAMFIHLSETHFFSNALVLYFVGRTVEAYFGRLRFASIYLLGGLSGSLASFMFTRGNSAGASGALFALIGAELVFLYQNRQLLGAQGQQWFQQALLMAGLNLFIGLATEAVPGAIRIDNWGHLGGFFAGIVLAWFIGPQYAVQWERSTPDQMRVVDKISVMTMLRVPAIYFAGMVATLIYSMLNLR